MKVHHYTNSGRFNLCSSETQQQVVLTTSLGNVSATWDDGEAPYDPDMLPTEVAKIIRDRVVSYWIYTRREEVLAKLDAIDAAGRELNRAFCLSKAAEFQRVAAISHERALSFMYEADDYLEEAE